MNGSVTNLYVILCKARLVVLRMSSSRTDNEFHERAWRLRLLQLPGVSKSRIDAKP